MKNNITLAEGLQLIAASQPNGAQEGSLPELKGKRIRRKSYYFAGVSSALGNNANEVILSQTLKETGITNFPTGGQLDKGKYFVATGIRILYDIVEVANPKLATWASIAPVCFKNGEIIIGQDGQPTLFESPGTDVTNFKASTSNDDDFREVGFVWNPQKACSLKLLTAGAVTASTYKVELRGFEVFTQ